MQLRTIAPTAGIRVCWLIFDTLLVWSNRFCPIALAAVLLWACGFFTKILAYCVAPARSPREGA
ncbi:hypothetical protein C7293_13800 [filamentous cyanobacterium CCT1]|nr:hypothetical protein C7293_13800 [filamentous cyanobacterium CCT1]PSN80396.1 hypothetical protein C8B47_06730 [filamentous cyanobacterium CCP4]